MATSQKRPEPKLPSSVRIGAHVYRVTDDPEAWKAHEYEQKRSGLCGSSDHKICNIWINPELGPSQKKDTLLHECLHAMYYAAGMEQSVKGLHEDMEEVFIVTLTPWIHSLLQQNPDLVSYVTELG